MTSPSQISLVQRELKFLKTYPHFDERPASITEFLDTGYLDIESKVRPGLKDTFVKIFGTEPNPQRISEIRKVMFTGAVGVGKTTLASIAIPYMAHWVLCLKDPQDYFGLLPGSRIAFMQMSTSESQAREVVFGDILARIKHADWFVNNYPHDGKYTKQIRFPKDIWILPGDSAETTFEGYNILGGILDEADSHKITKDKDYAELGFDTIENRIQSRYEDRGLMIVVGQMKKANGFAHKKYKELLKDPTALVVRQTIWESFGWDKYLNPDGTRNSFWYDSRRKQIVPSVAVGMVTNPEFLVEIPTVYKPPFMTNPEKALRDLAGVPPASESVFISLVDRITECRDKWQERYGNVGSPIGTDPIRPSIADWFEAPDTRKRCIHLDLAYADEGDALGLCMGHIEEVVENDEGEKVPYIVLDMLMRVVAAPGQEILFSEIRSLIYALRDDLGFRIKKVTMDGFQSTDTRQQLRKKRFEVDALSVDKNTLPYHDLREAIYERRLEFPPYYTYLKSGGTELVEIAVKELMELQDDGKKIDHPATGSKDMADPMAGVVTTLMGDRVYRRGVTSLDTARKRREAERTGTDGYSLQVGSSIPGFGLTAQPDIMSGMDQLRVPIPPTGGSSGGYGR